MKRSGIPLTDDEIADAISELNNLMTEFEADGTHLNYTIVSDSSDTITTPDWANSFMESNLALRLASEFEVQVSQTLAMQASKAEDIIIKRTAQLGTVLFPNTLPIGSGNETFYYDRFFKDTSRYDLETDSGDQLSDTEDMHIEED